MQFWIIAMPLLGCLYLKLFIKILSYSYAKFCALWILTTLFGTSSIKTLWLRRYFWVRLFEYTGENTNLASSFYTTDYGSPVTIRSWNKQMFSTEKLQRWPTLKTVFLDRLVSQPRHVDDVYNHYSSSENIKPFLGSMSPEPNVYGLMVPGPRLVICQVLAHTSIKVSYPVFFLLSRTIVAFSV